MKNNNANDRFQYLTWLPYTWDSQMKQRQKKERKIKAFDQVALFSVFTDQWSLKVAKTKQLQIKHLAFQIETLGKEIKINNILEL